MGNITFSGEDQELLKKEIEEFYNDIAALVQASRDVVNNTHIKFDPFLFMAWRQNK